MANLCPFATKQIFPFSCENMLVVNGWHVTKLSSSEYVKLMLLKCMQVSVLPNIMDKLFQTG